MHINKTTILSILVAWCCVKAFAQNNVQHPPATPAITEITISAGVPVIYYTVPTTDTKGNTLLSDKLGFRFFIDVQQEITLLTFTPADYIHLKEEMTVIPYGYNDHYDILPRYIFLHQADYNTWNKIGIQSITLSPLSTMTAIWWMQYSTLML